MKTIQKTCDQMLKEYKKNKKHTNKGEKINFNSVALNHDVYNITAPFRDGNEMLIAGRVEARDSEDSSVVFFCRKEGEQEGLWNAREDIAPIRLQDPFITRVKGEYIFGGVEVYVSPEKSEGLEWRTGFYRGEGLTGLRLFATGPVGMKDIRLKELPDGRIFVFTRPQGEKGGRGRIGYVILNSLEELDQTVLEEAPLINNHFVETEWGGVNEIHILKNGMIGALSHAACFDEQGDRHYYSSCFAMDAETGECTEMKMIACREDFPEGPAKRPDLKDVLFSGGLVRGRDGAAMLYCGVSDAEACRILIPDPFLEYEGM